MNKFYTDLATWVVALWIATSSSQADDFQIPYTKTYENGVVMTYTPPFKQESPYNYSVDSQTIRFIQEQERGVRLIIAGALDNIAKNHTSSLENSWKSVISFSERFSASMDDIVTWVAVTWFNTKDAGNYHPKGYFWPSEDSCNTFKSLQLWDTHQLDCRDPLRIYDFSKNR